MKIFWLGGVAEKEDFKIMLQNGNTQIAANVTQLNYIEGLEKATGESIKILNSHYEPSFPNYKKLFIRKRKWKRKGKENIDIGFINIPILKYIHKSIVLRKEMKNIIKNELSNKEINIFFIYAMTAPLMLLAPFIKKKIKNEKYKICLIVPDLPEFMNMTKQNIVRQILLRLNTRIIDNCMKYIDKYVLFAKPMADYLNLSDKDYMVIEGMVNIQGESRERTTNNSSDKDYIMYAGGLNEKYGVLNLVKAFHEIKDNKVQLWLYGKGDAVEKIKEFEKKDKRIKYKGIVNNEEIIIAEKGAKLLVNPRPTDEEYTKYSFPSKNMEYMLSGTPLVTTKLPAMPKEYYNYIYTFEKEDVKGFKEKLEEILSQDKETLLQRGRSAKVFVMEKKSNVFQAEKIKRFITEEKK